MFKLGETQHVFFGIRTCDAGLSLFDVLLPSSCRPPHLPPVHGEHDHLGEGVPVAVHRVQVLHPLRDVGER